MIIKSVRVQNFRSILDATLNCEPLTAIVGPNGAGKSSFLRALELFYASSPQFNPDDFYNKDTTRDIEITITFGEPGNEAVKRLAPYLDDGAQLTVTRVLSLRDGRATAKFYGSRLQNPEFVRIRGSGGARRSFGNITS